MSGQRAGRSRYSIMASGSRPISAATPAAATEPTRAYAQFPSALRGLDAGSLSPLGGLGRAGNRRADRSHPGQPPFDEKRLHWSLSCPSHPEQGFRTCLGVLRLYRGVEPARAEMVSARAVAIGGLTYKSIASILANRQAATPATTTEPAAITDHANLRGPGYFH
jgi:hypothetical protein